MSAHIELSKELGNAHTKLVAGGFSEGKARELTNLLRNGASDQLSQPQVCKILDQRIQASDFQIDRDGRIYTASRGAIWEMTALGAIKVSPERDPCRIYFFKVMDDGALLWLEEREIRKDQCYQGTLVYKHPRGKLVTGSFDLGKSYCFGWGVHVQKCSSSWDKAGYEVWIPIGFKGGRSESVGECDKILRILHAGGSGNFEAVEQPRYKNLYWAGLHANTPVLLGFQKNRTVIKIGWRKSGFKRMVGKVLEDTITADEDHIKFVVKHKKGYKLYRYSLTDFTWNSRACDLIDQDKPVQLMGAAGKIWYTATNPSEEGEIVLTDRVFDLETGDWIQFNIEWVQGINDVVRFGTGWMLELRSKEGYGFLGWPETQPSLEPQALEPTMYTNLNEGMYTFRQMVSVGRERQALTAAPHNKDKGDELNKSLFIVTKYGLADFGRCDWILPNNLIYHESAQVLIGWHWWHGTLTLYRWDMSKAENWAKNQNRTPPKPKSKHPVLMGAVSENKT